MCGGQGPFKDCRATVVGEEINEEKKGWKKERKRTSGGRY
jgi:hypothetical protein